MKPIIQIVTIAFAIFTLQLSLANEVDYSYLDEFLNGKEMDSWRRLLQRYPEARMYREFMGQPPVRQVQAINEIDPNSTCNEDLVYTVLSLVGQTWAFQMIDSSGKIPSGVTGGAIRWPGSFDMCQGLSAPPSNSTFPVSGSSKGFHGKYCRLQLTSQSVLPVPIPLQIGICVPSSCDESQLLQDLAYVENYTQSINFLKNFTTVNDLTCLPDPKDYKYNAGTICCMVLVALSCYLVVVGTLYDVCLRFRASRSGGSESVQNQDGETLEEEKDDTTSEDTDPTRVLIETEPKRGKILEIILAFSAIANGKSILDTSPREGQLDCIHGIRFLSLSWVILGHTLGVSIGNMDNVLDALKLLDSYWFQAMLQATFSVDTFFLMSGFLVAYLFLRDQNFMTCSRMVYFYVHRFLRLTPVYAIVIFVFATWWNYMGDGPFWAYSDRDSNICTKNWWYNILYINNFFPMAKQCMGWGWYLANDMQFYVISPLFLIPLKSSKYRIVGLLTILALLVSSWIATGVISRQNNFPIMFKGDLTDGGNAFDDIYLKPWTRIGPYLIGSLLGYCITITKSSNRKIHWSIVVVGWCIAIISNISVVYGLWKTEPGLDISAFYTTVSRSVWALSVAWVIFACLTNNAGPVNTLLSWPAWFPLSRLSYCAYLVHPMIIAWYFNSMRSTFHFTLTTLSLQFLGFLTLSYGAAFLVSIFYEGPIIRIEKILRG